MKRQMALTVFFTSLTIGSLFHCGLGARCATKAPTVKQTQVGFGNPPRYMVEVQNSCPMCPVISVHLNCGNISQGLVSPRVLKVLGHNSCVLNAGLPLAPLQKLSFNYSHSSMFQMRPTAWNFQCE